MQNLNPQLLLNAVIEQRDKAMNECATLTAWLAEAQEKIKKLADVPQVDKESKP
jgi:hypothetical protein